MKTPKSLNPGQNVPGKQLFLAFDNFNGWYDRFCFFLSIKIFQRRIAYFELNGYSFAPFIFTGDMQAAYDKTISFCLKYDLPIIPFTSFALTLQSGRPVQFKKGERWISLLVYLHS